MWTENPPKIWIIAAPHSVVFSNCRRRHRRILIKMSYDRLKEALFGSRSVFRQTYFHTAGVIRRPPESLVSRLNAWPAGSPFRIQMWHMPSTAEKKHATHNPLTIRGLPWNLTCPILSAKHRVTVSPGTMSGLGVRSHPRIQLCPPGLNAKFSVNIRVVFWYTVYIFCQSSHLLLIPSILSCSSIRPIQYHEGNLLANQRSK